MEHIQDNEFKLKLLKIEFWNINKACLLNYEQASSIAKKLTEWINFKKAVL